MELNDFGSVVWRWWLTLLVASAVAGACGYLIASNATPSYQGSAQLLVGPVIADNDTIKAAGSQAQTLAELVSTGPIVRAAASELGISRTVVDSVSGSADEVTRLLTVRVRSSDPVVVADMANALAEQLIDRVTDDGVAGAPAPLAQTTIVDAATVPGNPVSPNVGLITVLSALAALIGTFGLVLVIEYVDDAVRSPRDVEAVAGEAFSVRVGALPRRSSGEGAVVIEQDASAPVASSLRLVAMNIELALGEKQAAVLIAGVDQGEGSAEIAGNVAVGLTEIGKRVALVDTSIDQSVLRLFDVWPQSRDDHSSLLSVGLAGGAEIVLASVGNIGPNSAHDVAEARRLLERLFELADRVVVYGAPLAGAPSTLIWATATKHAVIVARRNQSRRSAVLELANSLRRVGAPVIGVVLNERRLLEGTSQRSPVRGRNGGRRRAAAKNGFSAEAWVPDFGLSAADRGIGSDSHDASAREPASDLLPGDRNKS